MNLGELADLTVANDNDLSMDVITPPPFWIRAGMDPLPHER